MNLSPLHDVHVRLGAKLVEFAGWQMPLLYRGILEEHQHTRRAASVFDVSHMGRLRIGGPESGSFLQRLCTRNLEGTSDGQSKYTHVCRPDGGILDDVIVSRYAVDDWLMVCNASNREKMLAWLHEHAQGKSVTIEDTTGPDVSASLVPVAEDDDDDENLFRVEFSASDVCDANPSVSALLNGEPVTDGQLVKLEIDDESETQFEDGTLEIEAPSITLTATATDNTSGNIATATASPTFVDDDDDD